MAKKIINYGLLKTRQTGLPLLHLKNAKYESSRDLIVSKILHYKTFLLLKADTQSTTVFVTTDKYYNDYY